MPGSEVQRRQTAGAHLCTIRKALVFDDQAEDGTTIEVFERDDVETRLAGANWLDESVALFDEPDRLTYGEVDDRLGADR